MRFQCNFQDWIVVKAVEDEDPTMPECNPVEEGSSSDELQAAIALSCPVSSGNKDDVSRDV